MGSITLVRLTLFNFRSFEGVHTLSFPASGLVILRGENHDTRGDSGAGKTNILLALAYVFGFCRHSAKALQCWYDEQPMWVEVELDTPEGLVIVRRGIKGITIGKLKGKAAEERLDKLCGIPSDLREILTYRDQVKPKKFLDMRDGALKKFLTQVLQLHGLDKEIDVAVKLLGELDKKRETAATLAFNCEQDHERREGELVEFYPEDTKELEAELGRLHVAIDVMRTDLSNGDTNLLGQQKLEAREAELLADDAETRARRLELQAHDMRNLPPPEQDFSKVEELESKVRQANGFSTQLEAADKLAWRAYEDETAALRARARKLHNELARVPGLVDDATRLMAEIEKLERDLCDRCGRQWDNAKVALDEHRRQLDEKNALLEAARAHKRQAAELDAQIAARVFTHDPRLAKLDTVRQQLKDQIAAEKHRLHLDEVGVFNERDARVKELLSQAALARSEARRVKQEYLGDPARLSKALRASQEALRASLAKTETSLAEVQGKLNLVRQANAAGLARHDEQVKALAAANHRFIAAANDQTEADVVWRAQSDYVDLLKGFRNKIFDEVLEAISADATAIIGTLPNSQHITVEFRSEKETQEGAVQEKITPVTYLHGEQRELHEAVSGGQLTSIGLAVDLAVAGVISQRLGCHLNWIVLDESFEGHDPITKQACLEMLQTYARDKLVIIVDHMSEFKEMFSKEIRVVFENKLSHIVQKDLA